MTAGSLMTSSNTSNTSDHPTSVVSLSRLPVFAPVKKFSPGYTPRPVKWETSWGSYEAEKELTQVHRDIVEFILTHHNFRSARNSIGQRFLFSGYACMKAMRHEYPDRRWLEKKLEEMKKPNLSITGKSGSFLCSSIVLEFGYSTNPKYSDPHKFGAKQGAGRSHYTPFIVTFSDSFMKLFDRDLNVYYPKLVSDIISVESGLIKAVIRFFLTHSRDITGWDAKDVLQYIHAIRGEGKNEYNKKIQQLWQSEAVLNQFGITLSKGSRSETKISSVRHKSVYFKNPSEAKALSVATSEHGACQEPAQDAA